ncbi:HNH endonuclease signature motif containing protein [Vibrio neonatus]|uniref:HNH endonuclease signature motif containing protein n=1 Tax=Vibrio neonatus TaxID=278860 RepID=UPI0021C49FFF|nr:HNH endonuclease signature motif containing protein [Vibrio neonatus]
MAKSRKKLDPKIKQKVLDECGNKCANPGCSNLRSHIHHIEHWAIYESNDEKILIPVCPSCHDAIHYGSIKIDDKKLYEWKNIDRPLQSGRSHIYIEPSRNIKLLTGTIALSTKNRKVTIFKLSENNKLSFKILDGEISLINLKISNLKNKEVLKVSDNHVKVHDLESITFKQVPGHIIASTKNAEQYIDSYLLEKMKIEQPDYHVNSELILLELEVMKPGLVKVMGCWADDEKAVIITNKSLSFLSHDLQQPLSMVGDGENSVLMYTGSVDCSLFGFKKDSSNSALKI